VFEMTTKQRGPDVDSSPEQWTRKPKHSRKAGGFALAAAVGLVTVALIAGSFEGRGSV
jgi:hypothetical protein